MRAISGLAAAALRMAVLPGAYLAEGTDFRIVNDGQEDLTVRFLRVVRCTDPGGER